MEELKSFLETAGDWEELPLKDEPGILVVKMPATKSRPALLAVKVNPMSSIDGKPIKKKGLFLTSMKVFNAFLEALSSDNIAELIANIESLNESVTPEKKYLDLSKNEE